MKDNKPLQAVVAVIFGILCWAIAYDLNSGEEFSASGAVLSAASVGLIIFAVLMLARIAADAYRNRTH